MTRFWWVRHGPTHQNSFVGWSDVAADLSDKGAIERLQRHLPQNALVISSDLQRCVKTADAICGTRQRLPHTADLREMNFGDWELKTFHQVEKMDATLAREYWANPGHHAPPNGESWNQTAERVHAAIERLMANHPDRDIIVVAHFGVILTQLQRAAQMAPAAAMSFVIDNLSVTQIDHLDPAWRIKGVNHKP
ncbi:MAG: histidine phosphatase family protein [Rhodobacteraceae bacterium]|nr:histidine phosphatase family protein [Paracoccaceae bacterium]